MPDVIPSRLKFGALLGVALAFLIFAAIAGYSMRMTNDYPDYDHERAQARYDTLAKIRHDEGALLNPVDDKGNSTATWADQDKGLIKIPIEEAMVHEVVDLKNKPAAEGCVIPGSAAAPAPATNAAPASTNAAPSAAAAPTTNAPASAKPAPAPPKKANK